jgi:hypothetical protein
MTDPEEKNGVKGRGDSKRPSYLRVIHAVCATATSIARQTKQLRIKPVSRTAASKISDFFQADQPRLGALLTSINAIESAPGACRRRVLNDMFRLFA